MTIIKNQRFYGTETFIPVPSDDLSHPLGDHAKIKSYQIAVYVGLTTLDEKISPYVRAFPAILDTGLSFHLHIDEAHLRRWAKPNPRSLRPHEGRFTVNGLPTTLYSASIWLHYNSGEQLSEASGRSRFHRPFVPRRDPICLDRSFTIAVNPASDAERADVRRVPSPRLPTLGLRALVLNDLSLHIEAGARTLSIARKRKIGRLFS